MQDYLTITGKREIRIVDRNVTAESARACRRRADVTTGRREIASDHAVPPRRVGLVQERRGARQAADPR